MGGMGFIHAAECEIMHDNVLINVHTTHAAATIGVARYFYSSSACVYRDMKIGEPDLSEAQAYPALPNNEYGWEKLYSRRRSGKLTHLCSERVIHWLGVVAEVSSFQGVGSFSE